MADDQGQLAKRARARSGPVEDYEDPDMDPEGPSQADLHRFSDVTITCAGCGTELMDDVDECWKCGRKVGAKSSHESGRPTWAVLTVIVLLALALGWLLRNVF